MQPADRAVVEWKREYLSSVQFESGEDIVLDSKCNPDSRRYVCMALALRKHHQRRHTLEEAYKAIDAGGARWLTCFLESLWLLYCTERALVIHEPIVEDSTLRQTTSRQRSMFAGTSLVRRRKEPIRNLAGRALVSLIRACRDGCPVVWLDNFNKHKFSPNPNEPRDKSVNGTILALTTASDVSGYLGWPYLSEICVQMKAASKNVGRAQQRLSEDVRHFMLYGPGQEDLRVPCDVKRTGVVAFPWYPWKIMESNCSETSGLILGLTDVIRSTKEVNDANVMGLLVDIDIYYRVSKLAYSLSYVEWNVRGALRGVMPIFGLWHAYTYCVRKCHTVFRSFWVWLETPGLAADPWGHRPYVHPKLRTLENVVVVVYALRKRAFRLFNGTTPIFQAHPNDAIQKAYTMLKRMFLEYIPALMYLGVRLREMSWNMRGAHTGHHARSYLEMCLALLVHLEGPKSNCYQRGLALALSMWTPAHDCLPAAVFVEEPLEASISRLMRSTGQGMTAHTAGAFSLQYTSLGPTGGEPKDLHNAGWSKPLVGKVWENLRSLLLHMKAELPPYYDCRKTKRGVPVREWPPALLTQVQNLWEHVHLKDFDDVFVAAVQNLIQPVQKETTKVNQGLTDLCAHVPSLSASQKDKRIDAIRFTLGQPCDLSTVRRIRRMFQLPDPEGAVSSSSMMLPSFVQIHAQASLDPEVESTEGEGSSSSVTTICSPAESSADEDGDVVVV